MSEAEKIAAVIKRVLIEDPQIDRVSDILSEISLKHFTVHSGQYVFTFSPREGKVYDCLYAQKGDRIWSAQKDKNGETPIDFLTTGEIKKLSENIQKSGLKCKIEAKRYYVVTVNGCRVNNNFNHGSIPTTGESIPFPESMSNNLFEDAETAEQEKAKFKEYHDAYVNWRCKKVRHLNDVLKS